MPSGPRGPGPLISNAGIRRVVTVRREPVTFVPGAEGTELLEDAGVTVVELPDFAEAARRPDRHLG
ncbi:hypothetical protein [Streptomyces solicamelliae]|uniref:hypothetical protein n=1 Tax=Streptomyces solicamelliae TaxID=3231716 RepID=UPI0038779D9D